MTSPPARDPRESGKHADAPASDFAYTRELLKGLELLAARFARESPPLSSGDALSKLPSGLPETGIGAAVSLEALAGPFLDGAAWLRHPGYFAHMDPPTPWVTWAAALWAAALNQNLLHPDTGPSVRALEQRVVEWLAPGFGMAGGHLVPGSTVANLTALWAARELAGVEEVVASEVAHVSIAKAAAMLGLPLRTVGVDERQRVRASDLGVLSRAALVLTAGTVAAGAIDELALGAGAAWRHIDAAWAGPLRFSTRHASLLAGMEQADSVSVSAHKWLFQPKECALVLFRDVEPAHQALSFGGGYLAAPNVGLLGSHGASALPLAATLLAWGREGLAARIDACMNLAGRLAELVREDDELQLWSEPTTGVVLWRPRYADARATRARLEGAVVSLAEVANEPWLRSVAANPLADPELVVAAVRAAARALTHHRGQGNLT
jgi:L-2,4-diaminobutyrate decarboxylase